jgi:nucleoside 2-deoxyribosyltransferase
MNVYLASRFSRLRELNGYSADLAAKGIACTSRWLLGGHEWEGTDDDALPQEVGANFAFEDLTDIEEADVFVCFTEPPRSGPSRGGRHCEYGYALAAEKLIIVVGHRENVFYCVPLVHFVETWPEALDLIESIASGRETVKVIRS